MYDYKRLYQIIANEIYATEAGDYTRLLEAIKLAIEEVEAEIVTDGENYASVCVVRVDAEYDVSTGETHWEVDFMDRGDMVDWLTKDDDLVLQYFNNPTELAAEILVTWDDDWTHGHPAREKLCG